MTAKGMSACEKLVVRDGKGSSVRSTPSKQNSSWNRPFIEHRFASVKRHTSWLSVDLKRRKETEPSSSFSQQKLCRKNRPSAGNIDKLSTYFVWYIRDIFWSQKKDAEMLTTKYICEIMPCRSSTKYMQ